MLSDMYKAVRSQYPLSPQLSHISFLLAFDSLRKGKLQTRAFSHLLLRKLQSYLNLTSGLDVGKIWPLLQETSFENVSHRH